MLRRMSGRAEQIFDEDHMLPPTWLFERPNGEQILMATPIELPDGDPEIVVYKQTVSDAMREFIRDNDVVRYAFASEVWIDGHDDQGRKEGVYIGAEDRSRRVAGLRDIIRPQNRNPYLGRLELAEAPATEIASVAAPSRFMGLLLATHSAGALH